ncbi:MFS transporter [Paenibacillus planticolens]|uniref:MFS transporter n=1 Tax=Paenibacillus planticolens TaxID=2654976 RepID=A0ABX1ZXU7_9BACL|nr:MFS transporter [Paenibacillus planticolens]NOV03603.1 MFS transporter [Paenibacillus planticolens]
MNFAKFRQLPDNPRYSIWLEPLWAIPGTIVLFYAPLYMKGAGLSDIQIGILNSVNLYFSFVFQMFAGAVTNKWGRKRTTLLFDLISWSIPMFIWAFSNNFWLFLIAYLLNASSKFVTVAFNLLIIEDVDEKQRSLVFAIMNMIIISAGVLAPLAGGVIHKYGIMPTISVVYFIGGISMTVLFVVRNYLTKETEAGKVMIQTHSDTHIVRGVMQSFRLFGQSLRNRQMLPIILITVISNIVLQLNFFQVIYLKEQLGFGDRMISWIPFITAVTTILVYSAVMPRLKERNEASYVKLSLAVCAVGALLFLSIPAGSSLMLIIVTTVLAAGTFLLLTFRDSLLMNKLGHYDKADLYSSIQVVMSIVAIPWGYISGLVYNFKPSLLFVIIFIGYASLFALAYPIGKGTGKPTKQSLTMGEER